ncbi:hypothetical protein QJS04_geneDACA024177 [Acorus gramineus]|uniref:Uncharacterized protein n=1 Tax=Acorus gramineus TaxID=55184 RepID=A0AAV8ZZ54_ACOGR|nr:hypothetical protein QJS04_geneDACA024177 [Acorus gramineus]
MGEEERSDLLNKLERAETEVAELRRRRSEDAKANEKVVSIFAAQEQSWLRQKKSLTIQIQALVNQLRALGAAKDESSSNLNKLLEEKDLALADAEEKARKDETALIKLVSNQRRLEEELEEMVVVVARVRRDAEQKEKILSAMLRKSKIDTAEKRMLLKELKGAKAKGRRAEAEAERWRGMCESRRGRKGGKGGGSVANGAVEARAEGVVNFDDVLDPKRLLLEYLEAEGGRECECGTPRRRNVGVGDCFDQFSTGEDGELVITTDAKHLQEWVRAETEKYASILEERHCAEIEAFTEQMRLKDEKLEAFHWQLLSMELEAKRLQSHMGDLDENLSRLKEENIRMEALLLDRETELKSLNDQLGFHTKHLQKSNTNYSERHVVLDPESLWSEVRIVRRKQKEKSQVSRGDKEIQVLQTDDQIKELSVIEIQEESTKVESSSKETKEKELVVDVGHVQENIKAFNKLAPVVKRDCSRKMDLHALGISYKIKRLKQQLQAIEKLYGPEGTKRVLVVGEENSDRASDSCMKRKIDEQWHHLRGFLLVISSLNKQVKRYQFLEEKTDDLCNRMHENERLKSNRDSNIRKTKEQTEMLERFLDETFQLQRYMVATGQRLVEIQSSITCGFVDGAEGVANMSQVDVRHVTESFRTLFKDVQRGLEVRIARIIGDIEGTIARSGILQMRR